MAAQAAAQLLDELMGRDRNLAPTEKKREIRWDDQQVCKHFLVKFCPNELFVNTRADLGPCDKIHDDSLKNEYEKSSSYQKMGYEEDFLRFCQSMMADVERRIRRGRQRLSQGGQEGGVASPAQVRGNEEKIQMLSERLNGLLEQVERLGCEGKVEEAQGIMKLCDQLKDEREGLRRTNENSHWMQVGIPCPSVVRLGSEGKVEEAGLQDERERMLRTNENNYWMQTAEIAAAQEKQMEVCEVCGAFLIVGDAQQRVDDHLMGKQHMGFAKIKSTVDEILNTRQREREEREEKREKEREERRKQREEEERAREKEREDRRKKLEDEKRKERDRERRKRKRSRSRDRDRKRSRSTSRSRSRKHSRSRSRDRRRSTSRARHSHSKDRSHRSHSKDRRRSHSRSRSEALKKSRHSHSRSPTRDRKDKHRDSSKNKHKDTDDRYSKDMDDRYIKDKDERYVKDKDDRYSRDVDDRYGPLTEAQFNDNGRELHKDGRTGWDSPSDTPTQSVAEDASPSNSKSADGTKWQVSGWTEIRQRHDADSNGAKSEGDSEQ